MSPIERVVDAHIHLWDPARTDWYPYLTGAEELGMGDVSTFCRRFDHDTYFAETDGWNVDKFVHVTAARVDQAEETLELEALAEKVGNPAAIIGAVVAGAPLAETETMLDEQLRATRFRGVRAVRGTSGPRSQVGQLLSSDALRALDERGLVYDFMAHPSQFDAAAELFAPFPNLVVVVEHTGWPRSDSDEEFVRWKDGMRKLASLGPNLVCKLSGLAMPLRTSDADTYRRWIQGAIEIFGVDRCMFASNFPVDGVGGTFGDLFSTYDTLTSHLDEEARGKLFATNAERIYRC